MPRSPRSSGDRDTGDRRHLGHPATAAAPLGRLRPRRSAAGCAGWTGASCDRCDRASPRQVGEQRVEIAVRLARRSACCSRSSYSCRSSRPSSSATSQPVAPTASHGRASAGPHPVAPLHAGKHASRSTPRRLGRTCRHRRCRSRRPPDRRSRCSHRCRRRRVGLTALARSRGRHERDCSRGVGGDRSSEVAVAGGGGWRSRAGWAGRGDGGLTAVTRSPRRARPPSGAVSTQTPSSQQGHRVLDVRGDRAVPGDHGPAVVELDRPRRAHRDHRLDGQRHARHQPRALAGPAVVEHVRVLVHLGADAVPAVAVDDAVPAGLADDVSTA